MSQPYPPDSGQPQPPYQQPYPQQQPSQYPQQVYGDMRNQLPLPPQQSPRKRRRKWPFIVGGILLLVIVIIVIASAASSGGSPSSTTGNTSASTTTSNTSSTHSIGQAVTSGTWVVTVNTVSTSHGSGFIVPKAGNVFIVINVTLKNTDASAQPASSLAMFALKDSSGQTYNQDITYGGSPDGNVASGSLLRGKIAYEVPAANHNFTLQFTPGFDASQLVEWSIKD